ncbi:hypothetical protein ACA910_006508 [Epithemia clementina (nom. ined.)]
MSSKKHEQITFYVSSQKESTTPRSGEQQRVRTAAPCHLPEWPPHAKRRWSRSFRVHALCKAFPTGAFFEPTISGLTALLSKKMTFLKDDTLIGFMLETRVWEPRTKAELDDFWKLAVQVRPSQTVEIPDDCLTDEEAYNNLISKYYQGSRPEGKPRVYQSPSVYASFASPEGIILTHIKVKNGMLKPRNDKDQLSNAKPEEMPVFVLYTTTKRSVDHHLATILEKGDVIHETIVYDKPEWTHGSKIAATTAGTPKEENAARAASAAAVQHDCKKRQGNHHKEEEDHHAYIDFYDHDYDDREEEFTPTSGWYRTGDGDMVYAMAGECPDYAACGKECGYCGRCPY